MNSDRLISEYIISASMMKKLAAKEYHERLKTFKKFIEANYPLGLADLISKIKKNKEDVYFLLNAYARYLSQSKISKITLKQRIVTIKKIFLEYHEIDVSPRRYNLKVKLQRIGNSARDDGNERQRQMTLHSFRRLVKDYHISSRLYLLVRIIHRTFWLYLFW
ncbi:MAG TPA: hypothetical protein VH500_03225 [Nitrososphaeraceae archaeon]